MKHREAGRRCVELPVRSDYCHHNKLKSRRVYLCKS